MSDQDPGAPSDTEPGGGADVVVHVVRVFTTEDGSLGNPLGIVSNIRPALTSGRRSAPEAADTANPAGPTAPAGPTGPTGPQAPGAPVAPGAPAGHAATAAPTTPPPAGATTPPPPWHGLEQQIAHHLGFSETVFIDAYEAEPGARSFATMRIFTPAKELPFAGHPTVGTAWWLREHGLPADVLVVPAGDVGVRFEGDVAWVSARASWTPDFAWIPLDTPAEVEALDPASFSSGHHYAYSWTNEEAGALRSRMFAPEMGIGEDEATGAAAVSITARLGRDLDITQGRGSRLHTRHLGDELIEVGGKVVNDSGVSVHIG